MCTCSVCLGEHSAEIGAACNPFAFTYVHHSNNRNDCQCMVADCM
jgi:hypothetical protein